MSSNAPILEGTGPLVSDRYIITLTAAVAITMGQFVEISTDWTIDIPAAANSLKVAGIALINQPNIGGSVSVVCRGLCRAISGGVINAGDQITNGTNGQVITDNASKNSTIRGIALSSATAAGQVVYILLW
jgi:hypothetical protein